MKHNKPLKKQGRPKAVIREKKRIGIDVSVFHKVFVTKAALMRDISIVAFITDAMIQKAERVLNQNFADFYKSETEKKAIMQPFNDEDDDDL